MNASPRESEATGVRQAGGEAGGVKQAGSEADRVRRGKRGEAEVGVGPLDEIASFRRRYNTHHPRGPQLLLAPKDHTGTQVPVMSLVVVSPQPHPQLLDLHDAASTLADLITYTPPSLPAPLPKKVRGASVVAREQRGSSVECALLLVSVLVGAGYRALVVQGSASADLVARDTSNLPCPYLITGEKEDEMGQEEMISKYSVRPPPDLSSRYIAIMEERRRREQQLREKREAVKAEKKEEKKNWEEKGKDAKAETKKKGEGGHLHFWVVVLPPERQVTTPTFVEATTGQVTPITPTPTHAHPYTSIHAVFSHVNYWAAIKPIRTIRPEMLDLSDETLWLPLIRTQVPLNRTQGPSDVHKEGEQVSCAPSTPAASRTPAFTPHTPVVITEKALRLRFPGGWREEVYRGVVVRRYSSFSHSHGATLIICTMHPNGKMCEVREEFKHRADRLLTRVTCVDQGAVTETFATTRPDTLREHQYWRCPKSLALHIQKDGVENPWAAQEPGQRPQHHTRTPHQVFLFHSRFRVDALRRREVGGTVWHEEYDPRPDLLLARTVTFSAPTDSSSTTTTTPAIQKIEEEFSSCTDGLDSGVEEGVGDVQRRVFQVSEGRILLVYHYGKHRLLQPTRTFIKPPDGRCAALTPDMIQSFQPDPGAEEPPLPQLSEELAQQIAAETTAMEQVRRALEETAALMSTRQAEHCSTQLLPSLFDAERNTNVQHILRQRQWEEEHREETERKKKEEREGNVDMVAPYLPLLQISEGYEMVRERCLNDLRERLALRANLLQDTLDQARARVLECREEESRRKRVTGEERAALVGRTAAAEAAHRRLRAHLAAWKHEAAERYEAMVARLDADTRLNVPTSATSTTNLTTTTMPGISTSASNLTPLQQLKQCPNTLPLKPTSIVKATPNPSTTASGTASQDTPVTTNNTNQHKTSKT